LTAGSETDEDTPVSSPSDSIGESSLQMAAQELSSSSMAQVTRPAPMPIYR